MKLYSILEDNRIKEKKGFRTLKELKNAFPSYASYYRWTRHQSDGSVNDYGYRDNDVVYDLRAGDDRVVAQVITSLV